MSSNRSTPVLPRSPRLPERATPNLPGFARQVWIIFRKDLRLEMLSGEVTTTTGFFALLITIIASISFFGGSDPRREVAPGVIWIAVSFAAIFALGRSWQREREEGALLGLLATPLSRAAIFSGKTLSLFTFIVVVEAIVVPACALFFSLALSKVWLGLFALFVFATPGMAAAGTLFGAMTLKTRARDVVLATVMLPLLAPSILTGVAGTRALFDGATLAQLRDYLLIQGLFAAIFFVAGLVLFGALIEG